MINEVVTFKNAEGMFTELFSLLKKYESQPEGFQQLAYKTEELKVMHQHIDNAIDILLHGLQDLGRIVGFMTQNDKAVNEDISNIGYLISGIGNLTEALNILRLDADYVLEQRKEENFL